MANIGRLIAAAFFLGGSVLHTFLALTNPQGYLVFGSTSLIPGFSDLWLSFIMPNMTWFALALAAFELTTGLLLLSKGRLVKVGLALAFPFYVFILQLGLTTPATDFITDFLANRLIMIIWILWQVPFWFVNFDQSFPEWVGSKFRRNERHSMV